MDVPEKPVACNSGLPWLIYGLLDGIVASYLRLRGFPDKKYAGSASFFCFGVGRWPCSNFLASTADHSRIGPLDHRVDKPPV